MAKSESKVSVYDVITERVLALLDKGEIPWRKLTAEPRWIVEAA
jgi:antirestriction protein ArdC